MSINQKYFGISKLIYNTKTNSIKFKYKIFSRKKSKDKITEIPLKRVKRVNLKLAEYQEKLFIHHNLLNQNDKDLDFTGLLNEWHFCFRTFMNYNYKQNLVYFIITAIHSTYI